MRKHFPFLHVCVAAILLFVGGTLAYAMLYATSSGIKTEDAEICSTSAYVTSVTINTDGTNDANVVLKDGGASGVTKYQLFVDGPLWHNHKDFPHPLVFPSSVYADVTGTGATYIVEYSERK